MHHKMNKQHVILSKEISGQIVLFLFTFLPFRLFSQPQPQHNVTQPQHSGWVGHENNTNTNNNNNNNNNNRNNNKNNINKNNKNNNNNL